MDVTANVLLISRSLVDVPDNRRYGYELMRTTGLRPASMYQVLRRMEADGWVTSYWEDGDPRVLGRRRRRYYELTDRGRTLAVAQLRRWSETLRGSSSAAA